MRVKVRVRDNDPERDDPHTGLTACFFTSESDVSLLCLNCNSLQFCFCSCNPAVISLCSCFLDLWFDSDKDLLYRQYFHVENTAAAQQRVESPLII